MDNGSVRRVGVEGSHFVELGVAVCDEGCCRSGGWVSVNGRGSAVARFCSIRVIVSSPAPRSGGSDS